MGALVFSQQDINFLALRFTPLRRSYRTLSLHGYGWEKKEFSPSFLSLTAFSASCSLHTKIHLHATETGCGQDAAKMILPNSLFIFPVRTAAVAACVGVGAGSGATIASWLVSVFLIANG